MAEDKPEIRRPEPTAEPQEPPPGGPHAVPGVGGNGPYSTVPHDLDPDLNPATDDAVPDEMKESDDTATEATKGGEKQESESEPA